MNGRRSVSFGSLNDVAEDVRHLLADGYTTHGNWNLSQVCCHLNDWMRYPMDGYPKTPAPIAAFLWLMRATVGRRQLKRILEHGFRAKTPTMPQTVHADNEMTDDEAVNQFRATLDRLQNYQGPIAMSPVFGELSREETIQLQLQHCAHHLSFLTPKP